LPLPNGHHFDQSAVGLEPDPVARPDAVRGIWDAHDGRQAILPRHYGAVREQATNPNHEATRTRKAGRPNEVGHRGDHDLTCRERFAVMKTMQHTRRAFDEPAATR
jgi:hypothetical protein